MSRRKICMVTGTRAEYGLLYWTMKKIAEDSSFELQLLVTGMHLAPEFGLTYKRIEEDGFKISRKVEMLLSSDTAVGINKSIGLGMIGMAEAYESLKPDMVFLLGDRFEIFAAASAALISRLPVIHCHGGEATAGAVDESLRHAITKMSHVHFTSTDVYRKRVIQLGEDPAMVFNVGALGIENINQLVLLDRSAFETSIGFSLGVRNVLVTFHPATLENTSAETQFGALLRALKELTDVKIIFTKANADADGRVINQMIDEFVKNYPDQSIAFTSLGQLRYLSALQYMDAVIGNSSSGIIEVPAFRKPVVNIGDRQKGRIQAENVINCLPEYESIRTALIKALNQDFYKGIQDIENPYGTGNASDKIMEVLRTLRPDELVMKYFHDIKE